MFCVSNHGGDDTRQNELLHQVHNQGLFAIHQSYIHTKIPTDN